MPTKPTVQEVGPDQEVVRVPIKVDVRAIPALPKSRYWVGLRKECESYSYVGVAGVMFHKIVEPPRLSPDGTTTTRNQYLGHIESLTDEDVGKIIDRVQKKVVRGGKIQNLDNAHQHALPGDIPLARYLYMVKLKGDYMPNRDPGGDCPEAMARES